MLFFRFFFFKQKTAYEMRISDWSSDVCSSDLPQHRPPPLARTQPRVEQPVDVGERRIIGLVIGDQPVPPELVERARHAVAFQVLGGGEGPVAQREQKIGSASCRERVCQYV